MSRKRFDVQKQLPLRLRLAADVSAISIATITSRTPAILSVWWRIWNLQRVTESTKSTLYMYFQCYNSLIITAEHGNSLSTIASFKPCRPIASSSIFFLPDRYFCELRWVLWMWIFSCFSPYRRAVLNLGPRVVEFHAWDGSKESSSLSPSLHSSFTSFFPHSVTTIMLLLLLLLLLN